MSSRTIAEIMAETARLQASTARIKAWHALCQQERALVEKTHELILKRGRLLARMDAALREMEAEGYEHTPRWIECLYGPRPNPNASDQRREASAATPLLGDTATNGEKP